MSDELNSTMRERALHADNELLYKKIADLEGQLKAANAEIAQLKADLDAIFKAENGG